MPKHVANTLPIAPEQARIVVKLAEGRPELVHGNAVRAEAVLRVVGARPIEPFFRGLTEQLATLRSRQLAAAGAGTPPVDLSLYFEVLAANGDDARQLVPQLNALAEVELAYARELPAPPPGDVPPTTPDFTAMQGYRAPSPSGFDALAIDATTGASGAAVRLLDVEWGWDFGHEDIARLVATALVGPPIWNPTYNNHGLAAMGIVVADADEYGVSGTCPDVTLHLATDYPSTGYSVATAIAVGLPLLQAGDVMLLEAQTSTPLGLGPTEWIQADFDAILLATTLGITTVEPAGNGSVDLDSPSLGGLFQTAVRDSGAIMVGASNGGAFTRASFSSFGSRVDVNGWGAGVATTGYGALFHVAGTTTQDYTGGFNGTSSGSAIIASVVTAVRSAAAAQLAPASVAALDPLALRTLFRNHGAPIPTIGRRPDARAILTAAGILRGLDVRAEPMLGQTCWLDLTAPPGATPADLYALFGGPAAANAPLPAPFEPGSRLLVDLASAAPFAFGTISPVGYSIAVPNDPSLRGQSFYFQAVTIRTATGDLIASNGARVFLRR